MGAGSSCAPRQWPRVGRERASGSAGQPGAFQPSQEQAKDWAHVFMGWRAGAVVHSKGAELYAPKRCRTLLGALTVSIFRSKLRVGAWACYQLGHLPASGRF